MANEIKEIGEIVKKCKILLLDIEGTTTSISFVKDKLFPYAEENVKQFLDSQWEADDVKAAVGDLRKLALEDQEKSVEGVVSIPGEDASKDDQIEGLVKNVKWQMSLDRKVGPLKQLQGLIWKQGYDKGDIKGHVYDDVSPALEQWRSVEGRKVYIYSSGSVDAQKLLFGQSVAGDLLPLIDGHFDTAVGGKQEAGSYAAIVEKIGAKPEEILFLTDIVNEAEAARAAGLQAALVWRAGSAALPPAAGAFALVQGLDQLAATNKRKPDDAQDEVPAKVAKTDVEDDVKTASTEAKSKEPEAVAPVAAEPEAKAKTDEKPEQMEVEETAPVPEPVKEDKVEDVPMDGPVVEEVTDAKDLENVPVCEKEPIITEEKDKTELKETEKMEAEPVEEANKQNGTAEVKNGDVSAPVAEETPPVITEIEEVGDKHDLGEIIDDLEPVVEEPAAVEDMEDLQNVGEVLEKECDEILSKVQDVTNLDNIPLKPLLNPIAEETMETENVDSNDIVDRILDTELELEMKQCPDIDLNTVQEITEPKTDAVEEKPEKAETVATVTETDVAISEEKPAEVEEKNVTDGNASSSPVEPASKMEEVKEEVKSDEAKTEETKSEEAKTETTEVEAKVEDSKVESSPVEAEKESKEAEVKDTLAAEVEKKESVPENGAEAKDNEKEPQVNGKATNGNAEVNVNGDSKAEELSARLSVEENGKKVNGSNGDAANEAGAGEGSVADIKVKTVAEVAGEPRTDPIDQPTEA